MTSHFVGLGLPAVDRAPRHQQLRPRMIVCCDARYRPEAKALPLKAALTRRQKRRSTCISRCPIRSAAARSLTHPGAPSSSPVVGDRLGATTTTVTSRRSACRPHRDSGYLLRLPSAKALGQALTSHAVGLYLCQSALLRVISSYVQSAGKAPLDAFPKHNRNLTTNNRQPSYRPPKGSKAMLRACLIASARRR